MAEKSVAGKLASLDGLRGLLAAVVFFGHVQQIILMPFQADQHDLPTQVFGWMGLLAVICFFCLSGYVIALSIQQNCRRNGGFAIGEYGAARVLRVLPALVGVIVITWALGQVLLLLSANEVPPSLRAARSNYALDWTAQLTCLATACFKGDLTGGVIGPLWTLAYEIQLYVLAGIGAYVAFSKSPLAYRLGALIVAVVLFKGVLLLEAGSPLNMRKVFYVCFAFGFAASLLKPRIDNSVWRLWPVPLLLALPFMKDYFAGRTSYLAIYSDAQLLLAEMLFGLAFSLALPLIERLRPLARLRQLGSYSYTLYILHFPVLLFAFFLLFNWSATFVHDYRWALSLAMAGLALLTARHVGGYLEDQRWQRHLIDIGMARLATVVAMLKAWRAVGASRAFAARN